MRTPFLAIEKCIGIRNKQAKKLALNYRNACWLIAGTIAVVIALEYATPSPYVFGYLYTGPIVLTSSRLSRKATFQVTLAASVFTLLICWFPDLNLMT